MLRRGVGSSAPVGGWRPPRQFRQRCVVVFASRKDRAPESGERAHAEQKLVERRTLFCFGTGYTALALCAALQEEGSWTVHGTFRRREMEQPLRNCGIVPHFCSTRGDRLVLSEEARLALQESSAILCTIPPCINSTLGEGATRVEDLTANTLLQYARSSSKFGDKLQFVGYISSTGVYGDWQGDWVDETCSLRSESARGKARIEAERAWHRLGIAIGKEEEEGEGECSELQYPVHIFRSGGIYGPLRNVLQSKSKAENVKKRRQENYVARCHVLDLIQVLIESIRNPKPGIYNVVDDCPSTRDEVTRFSLSLLAERERAAKQTASSSETIIPSVSISNDFPHWDSVRVNSAQQAQSMDTGATAGAGASGDTGRPNTGKRVSNQKIKSELGIILEHPSYVEGMKAIIDGSIQPFNKELLTAYKLHS